jgi:hypothetical protein
MTGPAYSDRIIKVLTGSGIRTDEMLGRGIEFIDSIRDSSRGEVINFMNVNFRGVAPIYFQEIYVSKDDFVQEDECVYKVPCPVPLYDVSGRPYINWMGGSNWTCADTFRIAKYRSELVRANKHHIIGRDSLTRAFYDTNFKCWWVYHNESVEDFSISQICAQPYKAPQYNIDSDEYPFPMDQDDRLMDIVIKRYFRIIQGQLDAVPNSQNDPQLAKLK